MIRAQEIVPVKQGTESIWTYRAPLNNKSVLVYFCMSEHPCSIQKLPCFGPINVKECAFVYKKIIRLHQRD